MAFARVTGYTDFKVPKFSSKPVESRALIYAEEFTTPNGPVDGEISKDTITALNEDPAVTDVTVSGIAAEQFTAKKLEIAEDGQAAISHDDTVSDLRGQQPASVRLRASNEIAHPIDDGKTPPPPKTVIEIVEDVIDVLERYRLPRHTDVSMPWGARSKILVQVEHFVFKNEPVCMVLPAFPFKSPNKKTKVLGDLPDKGEEIALQHLDGLCQAIGDVYPAGGRIFIVSDGLMYNDLLGVSDQEVWRYGHALRQLADDCACNRLKFVRLRDLINVEDIGEPLSEEDYLRDASSFRDSLIKQYLPVDFDPAQITNDADTCLTYRGYIKFLETDLADNVSPLDTERKSKAQTKRHHEDVAKGMISRGKAFANSIAVKFPAHVRLSIHPSTETSKLSMSLIPQKGRSQMTPWHSSLVQALDGSIIMSHALSVPARTHDLIYEHGRPSYFRERSPLFHWPGMDVSFNYMYPCGLMVIPTDKSCRYSLHNVQMQKVRTLAEACSPVVLRGFADTTDGHIYEAKAHDLGAVAPWMFGGKHIVKDVGRPGRMNNNVVSSEAMPMHYDGIFKFAKKTDAATGEEISVSAPPRFQYFTAIPPSPRGSGYTLFAASRLFWQHLPPQHTIDELKALT
ncbi:Pyoverdine biosynthesis [Lasallia pustulata]|uniref:Pyoverdine biosynthesis n=1 Tax=Lasallia pustulata TaxID=136370 RepID=A0A1W5CU44_9LECA|nr:Pyoverdine biosynthesis [Lasallia pustulata]